MTITTSASITYQVDSVAINAADGSIVVTVSATVDAGTQSAKRIESTVFALSSQDCAPIWQGKPSGDEATRWGDLRDQLYGLLTAKGLIKSAS